MQSTSPHNMWHNDNTEHYCWTGRGSDQTCKLFDIVATSPGQFVMATVDATNSKILFWQISISFSNESAQSGDEHKQQEDIPHFEIDRTKQSEFKDASNLRAITEFQVHPAQPVYCVVCGRDQWRNDTVMILDISNLSKPTLYSQIKISLSRKACKLSNPVFIKENLHQMLLSSRDDACVYLFDYQKSEILKKVAVCGNDPRAKIVSLSYSIHSNQMLVAYVTDKHKLHISDLQPVGIDTTVKDQPTDDRNKSDSNARGGIHVTDLLSGMIGIRYNLQPDAPQRFKCRPLRIVNLDEKIWTKQNISEIVPLFMQTADNGQLAESTEPDEAKSNEVQLTEEERRAWPSTADQRLLRENKKIAAKTLIDTISFDQYLSDECKLKMNACDQAEQKSKDCIEMGQVQISPTGDFIAVTANIENVGHLVFFFKNDENEWTEGAHRTLNEPHVKYSDMRWVSDRQLAAVTDTEQEANRVILFTEVESYAEQLEYIKAVSLNFDLCTAEFDGMHMNDTLAKIKCVALLHPATNEKIWVVTDDLKNYEMNAGAAILSKIILGYVGYRFVEDYTHTLMPAKHRIIRAVANHIDGWSDQEHSICILGDGEKRIEWVLPIKT